MSWLPDIHGLPKPFWLLWVGTLINRLGGFVGPFLAIYLTQVRGMAIGRAGLIVSLVGLGAMGAGPIGGSLADRIGRRRALAVATTLGGGAMLALGAARAPVAIAAAGFALGVCGDLYRPAVHAIVADVVGEADRPRAYGLLYWVVNVGFAASLVIAGLAAGRSFGALFVADAVTTFAFGAILWFHLPETRPSPTPRDQADPRWFLRPYADTRFLKFIALLLLVGIASAQTGVTVPVEMHVHGISPQVFGALMAINGVMIVLVQPFAVSLVGRLRGEHVLSAGALLMGAGVGLTGIAAGSIPRYAFSVVVWTLGEIALAPVGPSVVADLAPASLRGSYQGAYQITWGAASFLAPAVGSLLMDHFGGRVLWESCVAAGVVAAIGLALFVTPSRTMEKSL